MAGTRNRYLARTEGRCRPHRQQQRCPSLIAAISQAKGQDSTMRSVGSLLDTGLAEATPKRDPLPWIKQKAAEVTNQAEQCDAAQALTLRGRHLIDEAVELEIEQARSAGATGYIAHFLAQATLPHTDPKTNHFKRGTGKLSLSIVANPDYGVPYGGLPRLLLAWMCTEAVRTGSPDLSLGRSQAAFLQSLDLHNDGRYIARVRDQSLRLVHSMITVGGADGDPSHVRNILIAEEAFVFWSSRDTVRRGSWESSITLSTDFFKRLISAPVPIRIEALRALRKSPLAMDIYTWLVYRMFTLNVGASKGGKRLVHVPWTGLMMQFGSGYANTPKGLANFKTNFRLRLNEALLFYPEARNHIVETKDHLILTPASLHIAATKSRG